MQLTKAELQRALLGALNANLDLQSKIDGEVKQSCIVSAGGLTVLGAGCEGRIPSKV